MCNVPVMPHGAAVNPGKADDPIPKIEPAKAINAKLDNLTLVGQRQLGLPGATQFSSLAGVIVRPPKDISRQMQ